MPLNRREPVANLQHNAMVLQRRNEGEGLEFVGSWVLDQLLVRRCVGPFNIQDSISTMIVFKKNVVQRTTMLCVVNQPSRRRGAS